MHNGMNLTVDSSAITPLINKNQTQLIFQRHCNYDRTNGGLITESANEQKRIVTSFINDIKTTFTLDDLQNTYFLFSSSNTTSSNDFKRCIETTNIAMNLINQFLQENKISTNHIINLDENSNYNNSIHESKQLTEPQMFTDSTGYLEF